MIFIFLKREQIKVIDLDDNKDVTESYFIETILELEFVDGVFWKRNAYAINGMECDIKPILVKFAQHGFDDICDIGIYMGHEKDSSVNCKIIKCIDLKKGC